MAKRKRLTPAKLGGQMVPEAKSALSRGFVGIRAPIADVAHDASTSAALTEVVQTLANARAEGRLIQRIPLKMIDAHHLIRDRITVDPEEMAVLKESIRARGQQTAIEVSALPQGTFGLISGWRRMTALQELHAETEDGRFAEALAIVRAPQDAGDAYVAMVEENEIRVGLSFFERARIVARAVDTGVYRTDRSALSALFAAVSRSKRSKIGTFVGLVRRMDGVLHHPTALTEKAGLALAKALDTDPAIADRLSAALAEVPERDVVTEAEIISKTTVPLLQSSTKSEGTSAPSEIPQMGDVAPSLKVSERGRERITLSGIALRNPQFRARVLTTLQKLAAEAE